MSSTTMEQEEKHKKEVTIIINGRSKVVEQPALTYAEVVNLAFDNNPPTGEFIVITVTYRRGQGNKPEGDLQPGESVKLKEGMIFNVTATDKS